MGLLLMQFRKMNIIQAQNNVEYQITDVNQQLNDYQNLSATLSNDSPTMADIAGMPSSLFQTGIATLMNMHNQSTEYANRVMTDMQNGSVFNQYGQGAAEMQKIAYMKAYEMGQEQIRKRIQAQLNQKEKELENKKVRLETKLSMLDKELEKVDQRLGKDVEGSIAGYGLGR